MILFGKGTLLSQLWWNVEFIGKLSLVLVSPSRQPGWTEFDRVCTSGAAGCRVVNVFSNCGLGLMCKFKVKQFWQSGIYLSFPFYQYLNVNCHSDNCFLLGLSCPPIPFLIFARTEAPYLPSLTNWTAFTYIRKSTDAQGWFRPRQIIQRAEGWYGLISCHIIAISALHLIFSTLIAQALNIRGWYYILYIWV